MLNQHNTADAKFMYVFILVQFAL